MVAERFGCHNRRPRPTRKGYVLVDFRQRREMVELILRLKGYFVNEHSVHHRGLSLEELLEGFHEKEK